MNIVKVLDVRYEKYSNLLIERDGLNRECGEIWTWYLKTFGQLITDIFAIKIECISLKKSIAFCQMAVNKGERPIRKKLDGYIEESMKSYYQDLGDMIKERDAAINAKLVSVYDVKECKKIYRQIAKMIHPDLHPELEKNETIKELWYKVTVAYNHIDLKLMKELSVLVNAAIMQLNHDELSIEIPNVEDRIIELEEEIERIKNTEPYIFRNIIDDSVETEGKLTEFEQELEEYKVYKKKLEQILATFDFEDSDLILN